MRKFLVSAALVTATLAAAAPASAQWAPQGNAYGYNNQGQTRRLEVRVDQVRRQIKQLDRRNILSDREARRLGEEARDLDRRINALARNGFSSRDRNDVERRLARLEQRIQRDANDGRGYGNASNGYDRDRDGRDDRYEDDRGRYPG
jgi:predicted RNase H-like nuclease (RuvC/YqgF family)